MGKRPSLLAGKTNKERKESAARRKSLFLSAYEEWGTIRKAAVIAGISRETYTRWHSKDLEFANAMVTAKRAFGETLEELALDRVKHPDKGKGSDVLLLGMLNANMSEKYRPSIAMNEDAAREVIAELRKIAKEKPKVEPTKDQFEELSVPYQKQLVDIMEKRGNASTKREEPEDGQPKHSDT